MANRFFDLSIPSNWQRVDESDDGNFYVQPRLVVHVDDYFIASLRDYFAQHLKDGDAILDLMSSYKSHLPESIKFGSVTGLGMNQTELAANSQLDKRLVQNLNRNPKLPFADDGFDAVLNTVSVQYLTQPIEVFKEVARVLKPGGQHIVAFSNRMFPTKAVAIWRENDDAGHIALVLQYFEEAGLFAEPEVFEDVDKRGGWTALFGGHDPVFIVNGKKKA